MQRIWRKQFFQLSGDNRIIDLYWLCYGEYQGKRELDLFLRYVNARVKNEYREEAYRIFISEQLRLLPKMKSLTKSYLSIISQEFEKKDTRTGKEVAEEAAAKMGVKINWGGEN